MSKKVISLKPTDTVHKAIEIFRSRGFHHIPLEENGKLAGVVSDRDVAWLEHIDVDKETTLDQFMNKIVVVCHEETPVDHLARVFFHEKINGMPVVDDDNKITGMVTHHDLLRWIYEY